MSAQQPEQLFGRKISLIAYNVRQTFGPSGAAIDSPSTVTTTPSDGIDLSQMHITFNVFAPDSQTPKTAIIRVFNLSDGAPGPDGKPTRNTAQQVQNEFSRVVLQAGYENGPFGVIFDGTIKQVRRGRASATDTFVEIFAADGDLGLNFSPINAVLAKGWKSPDVARQLATALEPYGIKLDPVLFEATGGVGTGGIVAGLRGKVLFGMTRDHVRQLAAQVNVTWHVENGVVTIVPQTGYLAGDVVVLTSRTGLIGIPEATQDGVKLTALLNPKIKVGGRVQIDNRGLNRTLVKEQGFPTYSAINFFADESRDGIYRVLVIEHVGDNRGQEWYSNITALAIDQSAPAASSVNPFG